MKIATLFSGIGAPEQGAKRVYGDDLELVFACEYDKFARQSFNANYKIHHDHFHNDVREMDGTQYQGKVDVLVGGSPCQAFSIAGLRNGTDDERGQLIYQYIRIVDEVKAPVIIYENVKGMLSIEGGKTIREFVQALRDICYYCHYEVVNTKDYGVPQNRERIFLVGFLDHEMYHRFQFAPKQKLEKRLKDVLEGEVDEKYYLSDKYCTWLDKRDRKVEKYNGTQEYAPCVIAGYHKQPTDGFYINTGPHDLSPKIGAIRGRNPQNPKSRSVGLETEQMLEINENGTSNCLTSVQKDNYVIEPKIQVRSATSCGYELASEGDSINLSVPDSKTRRGRVGKQVAQTLDTQCNQAIVQQRIRKLTPRECLRLQDFPEDFKIVVSSSQAYKQAGNSMSVNVLEMIFRQIEKAKQVEEGRLF